MPGRGQSVTHSPQSIEYIGNKLREIASRLDRTRELMDDRGLKLLSVFDARMVDNGITALVNFAAGSERALDEALLKQVMPRRLDPGPARCAARRRKRGTAEG
jgi:hypothetical protein